MRKKLWMLTAILICGVMTILISCSVSDNSVDNNMPTNKKLTGMYTVVLDNENGNIGSNTYNRVLVAYDFKDDYTGQWLELFYKDGTDEPFIGHGGKWRLPSIKDWQYMFIGCGASGSYSDNPQVMSYSELASKLSTAHGKVLVDDDFYWSSTKMDADFYWGLYIDGDDVEFRKQDDGNGLHVRACLAF